MLLMFLIKCSNKIYNNLNYLKQDVNQLQNNNQKIQITKVSQNQYRNTKQNQYRNTIQNNNQKIQITKVSQNTITR